MQDWPPISEPMVLARLGLSEEAFVGFLVERTASVPAREFTDGDYDRALSYPWARPEHSYLLTAGEVEPLDVMPSLGPETRYPLLAFGANGAPSSLTAKLADLPLEEQQLAVITGRLHDFDVGAAALPTVYGAMPGTIFESPGTVVSAALLWVTAAQLQTLIWTEVSYFFGRLEGVRFQPDVLGADDVDVIYAFVSRLGAHCVDGKPIAMAAVPATGRSAVEYTQEQLLDRVAGLTLGDGSTARDLVRGIYEDFAGIAPAAAPALRELAVHFESDRWTPLRPTAN